MAHFTSLSDEIVAMIVKYLVSLDLARACRVNRQLHRSAVRQLYSTLWCNLESSNDGISGYLKLARLLIDDNVEFVRHIKICSCSERYDRKYLNNVIPTLLRRMKNYQTLTCCVSSGLWDQEFVESLSKMVPKSKLQATVLEAELFSAVSELCKLTTVKEFSGHYYQPTFSKVQDVVGYVLEHCPLLDFLNVKEDQPFHRPLPMPHHKINATQITKLFFSCYDYTCVENIFGQQLGWDHLRDLRLETPEHLRAFASEPGRLPNLHALRFYNSRAGDLERHADLSSNLPPLNSFSVRSTSSLGDAIPSAWIKPHSHTLRALGLHTTDMLHTAESNYQYLYVDDIARLSSSCPHLEHLTIDLPWFDFDHALFPPGYIPGIQQLEGLRTLAVWPPVKPHGRGVHGDKVRCGSSNLETLAKTLFSEVRRRPDGKYSKLGLVDINVGLESIPKNRLQWKPRAVGEKGTHSLRCVADAVGEPKLMRLSWIGWKDY